MSLRARLALFYTSIVGGILLLFGMAVYSAVSITLINEVDQRLTRVAQDAAKAVFTNQEGQVFVDSLPGDELATTMYIQVWDRDGTLRAQSVYLADFRVPLDRTGLRSRELVLHDVRIGETRLRVLSVPLTVRGSDRVVATLQVATSMDVVISTQQTLLLVLLVGAVLSMVVAGVAGWISTRQALAPLEDVTEAALQITRADDLSRRIPYQGNPNDEVGQLITAFNLTLSRLENLFNTQRRFLADVGHELRTPLTVIKGNVELMQRMGETDPESMDSIENEVDRLTRMVGDLLLLAQAESGKLPLAHDLLELDTILLEVMGQMRILARDRVRLRIGEIDQVLICGDRDRIKQVLVNLVSNAIKYTPTGGEVIVGLAKEGEYSRLNVSDTGPGIPVEDMPHIFERFYRGEKSRTRTRDGKGFGLGLSIAYWIVRNHNGFIEVSAREPQGTTFCVRLPLAKDGCEQEEIQSD